MSSLICPICKLELSKNEKTYTCKNGHSFDRSKYGYVNLLMSDKMHSKLPGDTKEMIKARHEFLKNGMYSKLCNAICFAADDYINDNGVILDCGCSEGYYTDALYKSLKAKDVSVCAFDIAKYAVELASRQNKDIEYFAASSFDIPVKSKSFDLILNCFSPFCGDEFSRVLTDEGVLLYVVPGEKHLYELKEILYDKPYYNKYEEDIYDGFRHYKAIHVTDRKKLTNTEIQNLFAMTPYFWRTPEKSVQKLKSIDSLECEFDFYIHCYKRAPEF